MRDDKIVTTSTLKSSYTRVPFKVGNTASTKSRNLALALIIIMPASFPVTICGLAKLNCKHVDMKTEPSENRMCRSHSHVEAAGCVRPPLWLCAISYTSSGSRQFL